MCQKKLPTKYDYDWTVSDFESQGVLIDMWTYIYKGNNSLGYINKISDLKPQGRLLCTEVLLFQIHALKDYFGQNCSHMFWWNSLEVRKC